MNPKLKLSLTTVALLSLAAAAWSQRNAFDAAKPDGYFWYKDKPKQVQKKEPQPEEKAPQPQPAAQSQSPVLKPGSAEWFRQTEQKLLDNLSSDPSEKNALAYKTFERLLHDDVDTVVGRGMRAYTQEPFLIEGRLKWQDAVAESRDTEVLRPVSAPFSPDGGLRVMKGNIGRGVIKVSAVKDHCRIIEAPAIVFDDQKEVLAAFERGELERDFVCVVRFQGPRANGMPELHKLTPPLAILQDRGFQVALVTDGRMSGASGKVPAAIHMSPETLLGGGIGKIRTGDIIRFNSHTGELTALVDEAEWNGRKTATADLSGNRHGIGRELFAGFRSITGSAETGAMSLGGDFG